MEFLKDLHVLVLGLGESGLAMARWCVRCGASVRVWDSRESPPQWQALRESLPQVSFETGAIDADALAGVRLVLKSPGLAPGDERIAGVLAAARERSIAVMVELDLFSRALADLKVHRAYAPSVLAITGTNGKTTTTALTAKLVQRAGRRVAMAGNIGPAMLDTLAAALDREGLIDGGEGTVAGPHPSLPPEGEGAKSGTAKLSLEGEGANTNAADSGDHALLPPPLGEGRGRGQHGSQADLNVDVQASQLPEVWVLELSSFQLDGVTGFEPSAAAVLNLSQDHLDWHGTMAAYLSAKARVFGEQAVMVINRDDAKVEAMVPPPLVIKPPKRGGRAQTHHRHVLRFGLDEPQHPGDFGVVDEGGMTWLVRALAPDEVLPGKRAARGATAASEPGLHLQRLMPIDALRVRGRHNAANAMAALALATAIGCPLAPMLHGLRDYRGEPHRTEPIALIDGIEAFDDSKGTNVGATVAALESLGLDKHPGKLIVILGGDGKGQDFAPLIAPMQRHARAAALIGRDGAAIGAVLAATGLPMRRHDTLQAATRWGFEQAQPGDALLLSPACASLDMFRNYAHRAEVFINAVRAIAAEHVEVPS